VTDDDVDVIRERIDLAITISRPLRDSSLVRHHLADWALVLCASPKYLAKRGTPAAPHDLARHDLLALPAWHHPPDVLIGPEGQTFRVTIKPRVTSNNQFSIRQLTLMGLGMSFHAEPEVAEELASGRLVRVLPQWSSAPLERGRADARPEAPADEDPDGPRRARAIRRSDQGRGPGAATAETGARSQTPSFTSAAPVERRPWSR